MGTINMGNGYYIETLDDGVKILRCPDDKPGEMGHGIGAYEDISLNEFERTCKEWISNRVTDPDQLRKIAEDAELQARVAKRNYDEILDNLIILVKNYKNATDILKRAGLYEEHLAAIHRTEDPV